MQRKNWIVALLLIAILPMTAYAGSHSSKREKYLENKKKYIDENVPDKADFDTFMQRDLVSYFKEKTGKTVTVEYELLKNEPFQTGKKYPIAYPKFYLWVKLYEKGNLVNTGAARVAAIEKKRFEVTDFVDKKRIAQDEDSVYSVFSLLVSTKILEEKMKE